MYQGWAEIAGGSRMTSAEESAQYDGAFEAMKQLPPGVYSPDQLAKKIPQFYRWAVMAAVWRMIVHGLGEMTPDSCLKILPPKEEGSNDNQPKAEPELRHFCGSQGFGRSPYDLCPQCEFDRLVGLGVPEEIAKEAAWLRCFANPSLFPPSVLAQNQREYEKLEEKYGKKIP